MSDRTKSFLIWIMASHSLLLELRHVGCWNVFGHGRFVWFFLVWPTRGKQSLMISVSLNQAFCKSSLEIHWWYDITMFHVTNMTVYKGDIYEIKKYSQVKKMLAFTIESVSSCFDPLYLHHPFHCCKAW